MFNKKKCKQCKYHMSISHGLSKPGVRNDAKGIMCGYSLVTHKTCLRAMPDGEVIDVRGDDPNKCTLYVNGERKKNPVY